MAKESISRGSTGLVHPITGSYIIIDDDGNIRMGLEQFGDILFVNAAKHEVYIHASKVRYITDEIEWNELTFNKAAVNPTQPALRPKSDSTLNKELSRYGK